MVLYAEYPIPGAGREAAETAATTAISGSNALRVESLVGPFDGSITGGAAPLAVVGRGNLLHWDQPVAGFRRHRRWIAPSGSLAATMDEAEPRNWLGEGFASLRQWCDRLATMLDENAVAAELWLVPHARHILNDVQSVRAFLRERESDARFGVALAPADLFEPGMVRHALDHFERILDAAATQAAAVIVSDATPMPDGQSLRLCPLGLGVLDTRAMFAAVRRWTPASTPVILRTPGLMDRVERDRVRALLELGGPD